MILVGALFFLALFSGFFMSAKPDFSPARNRFNGETRIQRLELEVPSSQIHPTNPPSSELPRVSKEGVAHYMSVKVDQTFNLDYRDLRQAVMDSIEWHSINQIPHHFDFWQNLSRDELIKWTNIQSEMPEYKIWFSERKSLMSEYSQTNDLMRKRQLIEALNRNQIERNRISELVMSMAKAENPFIGTPKNYSSPSSSSQKPILEKPASSQPDQPKLFQ
jgi:hypothetical protein